MKLSEKLADQLNEFRYLPIPYGHIANELIELLDSISLFPTLPRLFTQMSDIPFLKKFDRTVKTKEINFC